MKISFKLGFIMVIALIVGLIASSMLVFNATKTNLENEISDKELDKVVRTMEIIDRFLFERYADMQIFAKRSDLTTYVSSKNNALNSPSINEQLSVIKRIYGSWNDISLINLAGQRIATTDKQLLNKKIIDEPELIQTFRKAERGELAYTDMVDSSRGKTMIYINPIRSDEGAIVGYVEGSVAWAIILEILQNDQDLDQMRLVSKNAIEIGRNLIGQEHKNNQEGYEITENPFLKKAFNQESGVGIGKIGEVESLIAYTFEKGYLDFKGNNWVLLAEIPTAVAFAPAREAAIRTASSLGGVLILSYGLLAFIIYTQVIKPIQNLNKAVHRFGKGDFTQQIPINSKDELGRLAETFNDMAAAVQESHANLELKVFERTAELNKTVKDFEEQNKMLEQNKSAMLNLLEDARELETKLTLEKEQVSTVINSISEGLIVIAENGIVKAVNPAALTMLEYNKDELINKPWDQVVKIYHGDKELLSNDRPFYQTIKSGREFRVGINDNTFYLTKSGKKIPVAITTSPLVNNNEIVGCVNIFHNISKEKAVKEDIENQVRLRTEQFQEEHARLESSINSLNIGFVMTDTRNELSMINGKAKQLLTAIVPGGASIAEQTTWLNQQFNLQTVKTILKPYIDLAAHIDTCLTDKKQVDIAELVCGPKTLHLFLAPIITLKEQLEVIGVVIMIEDITDQKAIERSRDEFFSIASHELRTPLTAIRGNTSMIQSMYADTIKDADLKQMIADIHDGSVRLINIVNDFLNVSRLEMGRMVFKNEAFGIIPLITSCMKDVESLALEKKLTMKLEEHDGLKEAFGDKDRLKEVITNLLSNAIKYTEQGGVLVKVSQENDSIKVSVIDTGKGIPPESQSLLFRKFQQASNNILTRDNTRSTGLGLYISKLMMDGMGGKIQLEKSEVGKGSIFSISVRIASPQFIEAEMQKTANASDAIQNQSPVTTQSAGS
jgi:two-component system, sensor histidine kinase and response regulator